MASVIAKLLFLLLLWYSLICLSSSFRDDYFILDQDLDTFNSVTEVSELFQTWKQKCEREYQTLEEETTRFDTFKSNLKYIKERNAKRRSSSDYSLGLNQFSDMSFEEFSKIYLPETTNSIIKSDLAGTEISNINGSCPNAPSSLDWRLSGAVTNVKDQGSCGCCWAFCATGAIEGINQVVSQWLPNLSEQQLISCDTNNSGCDGGKHFAAFQYVLKNGGIATERDYPYNASNGVCNSTLETNKRFATIDGYNYWWDRPISENSLFCAAAKQPISVSFFADQDFRSYKSGIFDGANFSSTGSCKHNHAMLIVGYGSLGADKDYWIVKNSWGTSWGQCGYVLIKRNTGAPHGVNNINCAGSYPTKKIK